METIEQMQARHEREMKAVLEDQRTSWEKLREQYSSADLPRDVYQQWDQQYGSVRLNGLRAQHLAEFQAYPQNPLEYRYEQESQAAPREPKQATLFEQLKQKQQGLARDNEPQQKQSDQGQETVIEALRRKQAEQQKQREQDRGGFDNDR